MIPLYQFRVTPYLFLVMKPFLITHMVLTDEAYILTAMKDDYFNKSYRWYNMSIAKFG